MIIQRNKTIDIIKGLGIFLVVAGHSGAPFTTFLSLFHMAIFFMASGYCFKDKNSKDKKSIFSFIKRKVIALWFPFVLWTAIFSILHNFFIKINVYTDNPLLLEKVSGKYNSLMDYWSMMDIVKNIVKALLLHSGTQIGGAFWFLAILFEVSILYCVIDYLIRKYLSEKNKIKLQGAISIVFLVIGFFSHYTGYTFYGIETVLSCYFLFFIGYLLKKCIFFEKEHEDIVVIGMIGVSFLLIWVLDKFGDVNLGLNNYNNPIYLFLVSLLGWIFLYGISLMIEKNKYIEKIFICMGQNTLAVLILHFLSFKIVSLVGVLIKDEPLYLIAAFPVLFRGSYWWIAYTFVGLSVPILLSMLWKNIKKKFVK